jgi:glucose dehydrogenase
VESIIGESTDRSDRRLLFAADNFLQEIDALTGKSISDFGENGRVDLREGLGRDPETLKLVQSSTPGRVFDDLLILGSATNEEYESGPGDIRAYNVRTGHLAWTFHTVPHPGNLATTLGRKTHGNPSAVQTRGADYLSMKSVALSSFPPQVPNTTSTALIELELICSAIA